MASSAAVSPRSENVKHDRSTETTSSGVRFMYDGSRAYPMMNIREQLSRLLHIPSTVLPMMIAELLSGHIIISSKLR